MSDIAFYRRSKKGINIDISNRCPLECMRCQRQTNFTLEGRKVYGRDATMDEIRKLSDYFSSFNFCGQLSDPVHHPKFVEILEYLYNKDIQVQYIMPHLPNLKVGTYKRLRHTLKQNGYLQ